MEGEKKIKRPRIFESRGVTREDFTENTEKKEYDHNSDSGNTENQYFDQKTGDGSMS